MKFFGTKLFKKIISGHNLKRYKKRIIILNRRNSLITLIINGTFGTKQLKKLKVLSRSQTANLSMTYDLIGTKGTKQKNSFVPNFSSIFSII
jgi:hypothetical protein